MSSWIVNCHFENSAGRDCQPSNSGPFLTLERPGGLILQVATFMAVEYVDHNACEM